ncbi:SDR family oxidoreductase [Priestia megaterium]|jgi:dTDP-4-dehydrorhamnose reductase|uniref:dTDP-4-dehydrorhamnose reductase family protein n=1 Tax=Priestia megaterium TaxID=1404 RepID=UPI000BF684AE|nr:SDR family oxidoreductase [Priestia megaterium]RCX20775.1 dTDP-4-dehydrorhamnose reductase [Bacillus sp. AG236]MCM3155469.1 SDR family oxidoreductase [Priestia megaterium]MEB2294627.1 SDR family oxidoreductase [Priestia megaterium]PEU71801.1 NAD(P)-dependent oxidoreductase [Priestia megaterium]PEZ07333.1 NAD(P)-dependent oxidoreductase [Priestia megaterium]
MKILVLGGQGMAGHVIKSYFQSKPDYTVYYTSRDQKDKNSLYLEIKDFIALEEIIDSIQPNIIINCIGILNENASINSIQAFQINSLLPHQLTKLAERYQGKLVHISTDCVFSGTKGDYTEKDQPDGTSIYAQSKQLGEVIDNKHLTVRTSIIGPELKKNGIGLFLWFMQQTGTIKGYKNVLWNGVTTLELAKAIDSLINNNITGLYHLGSEKKISKFDLLNLIKKIFNKEDVEIIPDTNITLDRTIKNTRKDFKYEIPSYEQMLLDLKDWMDI